MALPKAGSTLLFGLLHDLAPLAGLAYVSLQDFFFLRGLRLTGQPHEAGGLFRPRGYCYGGFRGPPPYAIPILDAARAVVLVRDPPTWPSPAGTPSRGATSSRPAATPRTSWPACGRRHCAGARRSTCYRSRAASTSTTTGSAPAACCTRRAARSSATRT